MFFLGLVTGFVLGAIWMVGARIVVKMRRERIVASSASHNSAMDEICANTPCVYCDHTVNKCNGCKDYSHFAGRKLRQ